jgi:hypothetical protein
VPQASAANTLNVSYRIFAAVEFTNDSRGVIFAQGSRFGGYTLFVKDGKLKFEFTGGTIVKVVFVIADDAFVDVEREMAAAIARD